MPSLCSVEGCDNNRRTNTFCYKHNWAFRKYGDPLGANGYLPRNATPGEKILMRSYIDPETGCREWEGSHDTQGYGKLRINGVYRNTHRIAYEAFVGPIPEGLVLDHLCRNHGCCEVAHLEAVTFRENLLRGEGWAGKNYRKTQCKRGHPYDEKNTGYRNNGTTRWCKACAADQHRRKKAAA